MKFMDYGYTDIGGAVYSYGIPGTAWEYNDAGQPIYTDYQTTANIYTHIRDDMLKKATVNMNEVFAKKRD